MNLVAALRSLAPQHTELYHLTVNTDNTASQQVLTSEQDATASSQPAVARSGYLQPTTPVK